MKENNKKNINIPDTFGSRFRKARKDKGLSQKDVANAVGYKRNASVSYIESDKTTPDVEALVKIAELFKIDLHWLITGNFSPALEKAEEERLKLINSMAKYIALLMNMSLEEKFRLTEELENAKKAYAKGEDDDLEYIEMLERDIKNKDKELTVLADEVPVVKMALDRVMKILPDLRKAKGC